jgi:hypothetical protein
VLPPLLILEAVPSACGTWVKREAYGTDTIRGLLMTATMATRPIGTAAVAAAAASVALPATIATIEMYSRRSSTYRADASAVRYERATASTRSAAPKARCLRPLAHFASLPSAISTTAAGGQPQGFWSTTRTSASTRNARRSTRWMLLDGPQRQTGTVTGASGKGEAEAPDEGRIDALVEVADGLT